MIDGPGGGKEPSQIVQEGLEGFTDNFGTPYNEVGDSQPRKDPQEQIPQENSHIGHG